MDTHHSSDSLPERRSEPRATDRRYYSVQFTTKGLDTFYQFKLWNVSPKGLCILVKDGSPVLRHLRVGDIIEMTYYLTDTQGECDMFKTHIKHITPNADGRFSGHCLVGLVLI